MGLLSQSKACLDALFTRTQKQLLGLFFGHPERSFYQNEIVRLAGVGTGSVQRELNRLHATGLLTLRRSGNQKHYQANPAAPIFPELCAVARKTFGFVGELRTALKALRPRPDLALLYSSDADLPNAVLRVLVVSDRLGAAALGTCLAAASERIGRELRPWLLDRRRFSDLLDRRDSRLLAALNGPKVILTGSRQAERWA